MMEYYFVYPVISIIPIWFIINSLRRIMRHFSDSDERSFHRQRILCLKYTIVSIEALIALIHFIYTLILLFEDLYTLLETILITIEITVFFTAWIFSLIMLRFEFRYHLPMRWTGHRIYWCLSFATYSFTMGIFVYDNRTEEFKEIQQIIALIGWLGCLFLVFFAFFRPNEFPIYPHFPSSSNSIPILRSSSSIVADLHIKIRHYKLTHINNRQVILFKIEVINEGKTHISKRNMMDFEILHEEIKKTFPQDMFPYLKIPDFPMLHNSTSIDQKMLNLEIYLNQFCHRSEFFNDYLLDFLAIQHPEREKFVLKHKEILEISKFNSVNFDSLNEPGSMIMAYTETTHSTNDPVQDQGNLKQLQNHCKVSIPSHFQLSSDPSIVIYSVHWSLVHLPVNGEVHYRYSEFRSLHDNLCKKVSPAKLPPFPQKNYFSSLKMLDVRGIEKRRADLERYLSNLLNDPAYQCKQILEFLNCPVSIHDLWSSIPELPVYLLQPPVTWNTEISDENYFQVYTFPIAKFFKGEKVCEWSFTRRFSQFSELNTHLTRRQGSPLLAKFIRSQNRQRRRTEALIMPDFPSKTIIPINNPLEIEERKKKLEYYMEAILQLPEITSSYHFRAFICDFYEWLP